MEIEMKYFKYIVAYLGLLTGLSIFIIGILRVTNDIEMGHGTYMFISTFICLPAMGVYFKYKPKPKDKKSE
jgi:hypothetical protein